MNGYDSWSADGIWMDDEWVEGSWEGDWSGDEWADAGWQQEGGWYEGDGMSEWTPVNDDCPCHQTGTVHEGEWTTVEGDGMPPAPLPVHEENSPMPMQQKNPMSGDQYYTPKPMPVPKPMGTPMTPPEEPADPPAPVDESAVQPVLWVPAQL